MAEYVVTIAIVVGALAAVSGATVAGVSAEEQSQAQSDAVKAESKFRQAQSEQSARQLRKANAKRIASMENSLLRGGVTGLLGSSDLDLVEQNAAELELQAYNVEIFGANAAALGKSASDSFKLGGDRSAAGAGIAGVGQTASVVGSGFSARTAPIGGNSTRTGTGTG